MGLEPADGASRDVLACPTRPVRIVIALESPGNVRVLKGFLQAACETYVVHDASDLARVTYDMAFIDGPTLERMRDAIVERQAKDAPLIVPHILLTPRSDVGMITREIWRLVDDVIVTPVEQAELRARFAAAWRIRCLSLDCYERGVEAAEANRRLEERVAGFRRQMRALAHDIRNPMNVILGFERLLAAGMAGPVTEEQARQLGMIEDAGKQLLRMAEDVALLARSGEPVEVGERAPTDLTALVEDALAIFTPIANGRGLSLDAHVEHGITLVSDEHLVERIVYNLLSNAIKYTEEGGVTLRIHRGDADTVVIEVEDTGVGISAEDQKCLFKEHFRSKATADRTYGLGLGLHLVKRYAEVLGGSVSCRSALGEGSTFTVVLPVE